MAPPPVFFTTTRKEERLQSSLKRLRKFGWEVESVRDEMGRLESRLGKLHKRDGVDIGQDEAGQEIVSVSFSSSTQNETNEIDPVEQHDLLFDLLTSFHTSEPTTTRDVNANFAIKPNRAVPSASPIPLPSGRAKRSLIQAQTTFTAVSLSYKRRLDHPLTYESTVRRRTHTHPNFDFAFLNSRARDLFSHINLVTLSTIRNRGTHRRSSL